MRKKRFIIIVLDGFGIGAMDDVPEVRPEDNGANTALHIIEHTGVDLPALERLGLFNLLPSFADRANPTATTGRAKLTHYGADTFFGHQEIMGTKPFLPVKRAFHYVLNEVKAKLEENGHNVAIDSVGGAALLVVDDCVTVGDNIEADFGQAYNVEAALDLIPFERVIDIAHIVRSVAKVSRVIAFGGLGVSMDDIFAAREFKELDGESYYGVNAPKSGVYNHGYECVHLGYGVNPKVQLPSILGEAGIPVVLIGKVADIVQNPHGTSISVVDTAAALEFTLEHMNRMDTGFICTNIQETDLCGHRMNPEAYADRLIIADNYISQIVERLTDDDILLVMADHGNDPLIGHSKHTRECVPLLFAGAVKTGVSLETRATLSDAGATAAEFFGLKLPENGTSMLDLIVKH